MQKKKLNKNTRKVKNEEKNLHTIDELNAYFIQLNH